MQGRTFTADLFLLAAALIWGTGFVAQRMVVDHVEPMTFNAARLALGGLALLPFAWRESRSLPKNPTRRREAWLGGVALGVVMMVGSAFQQIGLTTTTAGKAGFITGLYVVLVPFAGLALGHRTGAGAWTGGIIAAAGLYLLSVTEAFTIERGDLWVLLSAALWTLQILLVNWTLQRTGACWVACTQSLISGVLSYLGALVFETPTVAALLSVAGPLLYSGILSVGVAFTLQGLGQRDAPPSHAAIILSLEAVFAALAGWIWLGETMTGRGLCGCGLMLAGMVVSQLAPRPAAPSIAASSLAGPATPQSAPKPP